MRRSYKLSIRYSPGWPGARPDPDGYLKVVRIEADGQETNLGAWPANELGFGWLVEFLLEALLPGLDEVIWEMEALT